MNQTTLSDCRRTIEHLPWYANGTLDPDARADVETHLAACATCQRELRLFESVIENMPAPRPLHNGAPAFSQLLHRINRDEQHKHRWKIAAGVVALLGLLLATALPTYLFEPRFQTVTDATRQGTAMHFEILINDASAVADILHRHKADLVARLDDRTYVIELRSDAESADVLERQLVADDEIVSVKPVSWQ